MLRKISLRGWLFSVVVNLLLLGPVVAQPPGPPPGGLPPGLPDPGQFFDGLDRNGDGKLSAAEFPAELPPMMRNKLNSADLDRDGFISKQEFMAMLENFARALGGPNGFGGAGGGFPGGPAGGGPGNGAPGGGGPGAARGNGGGAGPAFGGRANTGPRTALGLPVESGALITPLKTHDIDRLFSRLDENKDGKVTADETPIAQRETIESFLLAADKNHDQALNKTEFRTALQKDPQAAAVLLPLEPRMMFQQFDSNGDGKLTADEIPASYREEFRKLLATADKGSDGALDRKEFNLSGGGMKKPASVTSAGSTVKKGAKSKGDDSTAEPAARERDAPVADGKPNGGSTR